MEHDTSGKIMMIVIKSVTKNKKSQVIIQKLEFLKYFFVIPINRIGPNQTS